MAAVGKRSNDFFIEEEAEEEVLTDTSSVGAPSPSGSSIGENSSSEAAGHLLPRRRLRPWTTAWRPGTASQRRSRTPPTP
jgi:hypothetical protein